MSDKVLFDKDIKSEEYKEFTDKIKSGNHPLYLHLITALENSDSIGVREDVLKYLAENASNISKEEQCLVRFSNYAFNPIMTVEHLQFAEQYLSSPEHSNNLPDDDFDIVFNVCVENKVPLSQIRELFCSGKDIIEIYKLVDKYAALSENTAETVVLAEENMNDISVKEEDSMEIAEPDTVVPGASQTATDVDVFNTLITLMTVQNEEDRTEIERTQQSFASLLDIVQELSSKVSLVSSEFVNDMKKDKDEIKKLNAMIKLMQKLLSSKQCEIIELRGEVSRLNNRIHSFESAEMRRDSLNQKITEVYRLAQITDSSDMLFEG